MERWKLIDENDESANKKKLFVVDYSVKVRNRGSSSRRKLVETDDMEKYIEKNFHVGYTYAPGAKMFSGAVEVVKGGLKYIPVEGGEYWHNKIITFSEYELVKDVVHNRAGKYYDYRLNECL